ncbi:LpqB family beta-propeller domain-containing protein [Pseudokineococcus basanitobsidens]|uniref:LpqB family beta-propeller domain-containing protein n=1 Tax=Pseudokineococcus basanitobsidens TaxID=1926649 RepID=A0ABU8RM82_9ACTN
MGERAVPGRERRLRRAAAATLLPVLLLLAGCVDLPSQGPVVAGLAPGAEPAPRFVAAGPAPGASPVAVVEGFLRASAAFDDDYPVARSYLAPSSARSWRPTTQVVVVSARGLVVGGGGGPQLSETDGAPAATPTSGAVRTVSVSAPLEGVVDARGRWTTAGSGASYAVDLDVVRVEGEWRIDRPPDEVVLGRDVFSQLYVPFELQWLTPSRDALVPEVRWFPGRSPSATLLVSELLAGPSPWLADAVTTAVPDGAVLLSEPPAVPLDDRGRAVVDLSEEARAASAPDRVLMQAQLEATLRGVPGVQGVQLSAEGSALDVPRADPDLLDDPVVVDPPVVLSGGRVARLDGDGAEVVPGLLDVSTLLPSDPAVGVDGLVAVLVQQRSQLLVGRPDAEDDGLRTVLSGADLVPPSVDRRGWVWSTPARARGQVVAVDDGGRLVRVAAPWLDGRRVLALRVSRDGARAAVVSTDGASTRLDVAGVVRSAADGGAPVRLDVPDSPPVPGLEEATDVTWVDSTQVALLGRAEGEEGTRLLLARVDGSRVQSAAAPDGVRRLTAATGPGTVLLDAPGGGVLARSGRAWVLRPGSESATDPSYPG